MGEAEGASPKWLKEPQESSFFFLRLFFMRTIFKIFRVYYNIACFMFCSFGHEPCEIQISYQGSNPHLLHWKVKS